MLVKKVFIFMSSNCPHCKSQTDWFENNNILFESKMIDQDQQALDEFSKFGVGGVPYTIIEFNNGERNTVLGFNVSKLQKILINKSPDKG